MNANSIRKAVFYFLFIGMAAVGLQAQNNVISWGAPQEISGDSDVSTAGTLVGTYSPYLILNPGLSPLTINGVMFQSNSLNAAAVGMTNSTTMGINSSLTDPNYANLLSSASDTPFNTDGVGFIMVSNLTVGNTYQVEIWAQNVNEPTYDQWENFWTTSSATNSNAVNYDKNSSETGGGIGQYVTGTFTASSSVVQITWSEWSEVWGSGTINSDNGQGQINLLQLRQVGAPAPQNQITWGSVAAISSDSDVVTSESTLVGTYSPYLILNPGVSSLTVNGVTFQSNSLNAVTVGMTNSANMGINANLSDPNYADLLSGASDTPFNTSGAGYILFSNVVPGNEYEVQIWAENVNEPTYDQWENIWAVTTSDDTAAVNYDNNGSETGGGIGEYVTGTFTPTVSNSVVQISWSEYSEVWGSGSIIQNNGQGQINLIQLRALELPPSITAQPSGTTYVASGSNVTLTAAVGGSSPFSYQWYETNLTAMTGSAVQGATNDSLTLSNLTADADYYLFITNAYGSTNSSVASVVVYTSPVIVTELPVTYTNLFTLYAGVSPTFSVSALGLTSLGYQWFTNSILDGAATSSNLTLPDVQIGMITNYCIVTDSYGSATSVVWTASVIANPSGTGPGGLAPYPQSVLALNPIGYWRMNDATEDGSDNGVGDDGYVCHDYAGGNDGIYTNSYIGQSDTYNPVSDPSDTSAQFGQESYTDFGDSLAMGIEGDNFGAPSGASVAFTVEAWVSGYKQGSDAGIMTLGWGNGGEQYDLDCGSDTSPTSHGFRFLIRDAGGSTHSVSSTVEATTTGQGPWYHLVGVVDEISNQNVTFYINGESVGSASCPSGSGILASTYPLGIGSRMSGQNTNFNDQFLGNINDAAIFNYALSPSQVASEYAVGAPNLAPFFVPAPETNAIVAPDSPLTIPVTAYGNGPLGYAWINTNTSEVVAGGTTNGTEINASFATNSAAPSWNNQTLELVVSNAYGATNVYVALTVLTNVPQFTLNIPAQVTVAKGQPYTYTASATGAPPLGYQWYEGATAISGQTGASYSPAATVPGIYTYYVVVTNSAGSGTSVISSFIVLGPPTNAYATAILNLNPVGYWPMHEVEAAAQGDIETNYGTLGLLGTGFWPDWSVNYGAFQRGFKGAIAGDSDSSVYFNITADNGGGSTNALFVPHSSPLSTLNFPFTVECWVYPTTGNSVQGDIWSQSGYEGLNSGSAGGGSGNAEGIRMYWNSPGFRVYSYYNGNTLYSPIPVVDSTLPLNQWYHVVLTCDTHTNMILYINGAVAYSTNATGQYGPDYWTPFEVGSGRGSTRAFPEGAVDEVAVYTNVFSATAIANHYNTGITAGSNPTYFQSVMSSNPVIYLRMDSSAYTPPPVSTWPTLLNFGSVPVAGVYSPGTMPGLLAGPVHSNGNPINGLSGTSVAQFNGVSSFADAGYAAAYNPIGANGFSIVAMFRGYPSDDRFQNIIGHSDSSWRIAMNSNGHLQCTLGSNSTSVVNSTGVYNDGNWHQIAEIYQPASNPALTGTNAVFVDGVLDSGVTTVSTNGIGPGSPLDVMLGSDPQYTNSSPPGIGRNYAGEVCEVALFTNALTAAEVVALYDAAGGIGASVSSIEPLDGIAAYGPGAFADISVSASGSSPLAYQWYFNTASNYNGTLANNPANDLNATTATLTLTNLTTASAGWYYAIVTNLYGSATSSLASLTVVNPSPTSITFVATNNLLALSWPSDHTGWQLQVQTNKLSVGINTNWVNVAGSTTTNMVLIPINLANGTVFYRLVLP